MSSADVPPPRPTRATPWLAVVLAFGMSGFLVWSSNGPKVALLDLFGETARAEIVRKDVVQTMGSVQSWDLLIRFEAGAGEPREFHFAAVNYPRVMDTGAFDVDYLPAAPWVALPAPAMHWSVAMLIIGAVPGVLAILLALVAWYERIGHHRPWARRLDAGMESAWQRLSDRLRA
jgi:hypothetical protein